MKIAEIKIEKAENGAAARITYSDGSTKTGVFADMLLAVIWAEDMAAEAEHGH